MLLNKMKIVLDANIFISAFFWGGNPRKVLERVIARRVYNYDRETY
jgi:predicted nucleic acid-binding protein